jgi:hypothetical protein
VGSIGANSFSRVAVSEVVGVVDSIAIKFCLLP